MLERERSCYLDGAQHRIRLAGCQGGGGDALQRRRALGAAGAAFLPSEPLGAAVALDAPRAVVGIRPNLRAGGFVNAAAIGSLCPSGQDPAQPVRVPFPCS